MGNTVYHINKGVNKSVEFRGLKAQYIWYLGGGLAAVLVLFAILYIIHINSFVCIAVALGAGGGLFVYVYRMNNRYGEHGLMRRSAQKHVPKTVKCNNRKCFFKNGRNGKVVR